jgi:hypothetical protein
LGIYIAAARKKPPTIQSQRETWLNLRKAHQELGKTQLKAINPGIYRWLIRHDRAWMNNHLPENVIRSSSSRSYVDWAARDEALVVRIERIARLLRQRPGKPVRVTRYAIGREMGDCTILSIALHKMPLTKAMIDTVTETTEAYAIRRIHRVVEKLNQRNSKFKRWELVRAACLGKKIEFLPAVEAALDDALASNARPN